MNFLPYISWGAYGATSNLERAAYFVSWGLVGVAGTPAAVVVVYHQDGVYFMINLGGGVIYLKQL